LDADDRPSTRHAVLEAVRTSWAVLEDRLSGLSTAQLEAPGPEGWSVKDHVAHIADWERATTAVLNHEPQYIGFRLQPARFAELRHDLDALNAALYDRSRSLPVQSVLDEARATHANVLEALEQVRDGDLSRTLAEFSPGETSQRTLLEKIAGDTYEHYAEHVTWIGELLATQG
jgi:hypothetical protein